jgi:hypothetical protein
LTQEDTIPAIVGAVAQALATTPRGDDEDRRLVRALVSVDAPTGDRVWLSAERGGRDISLRDAVEAIEQGGWSLEHDGFAPWCAALRPEFVGAFDVDPVEVWERCLPHYRGFLHAWTDQHTARAHYKRWPRERQSAFEHEYMLYADNNRSFAERHGVAADAGLQEAAAWLRSKRRYVFRWTIVVRDEPAERPAWLRRVEPALHEQAVALRTLLPSTPWDTTVAGMLDDAIGGPPSTEVWADMLRRLEYGESRIRVLGLVHRLRRFLESIDRQPGSKLANACARLSSQLDDAIRWCW